MRVLFALAVAAFSGMSALSAAAQQSADICAATWEILSDAIPLELSAEVTVEGPLCVASGIVGRESLAELAIERITWEGQGLARLAEERIPPRSLVVSVDGARAVTLTGDPRTDYVRRAQAVQSAVSGRLELRWDGLTNRLFMDTLAVDFPGENTLRMSGQAGGVNLSTMSALRTSLGSAVLTNLTIDVTTFGLFETYLLERLVLTALAPTDDPETAMPRIVAGLVRQVDTLPETSFSPETKAELIDFLDDLPNPGGDMRLTVTADPPLGWIRLVPTWLNSGGTRDPATLLDGVRVRFDYTARPPSQ